MRWGLFARASGLRPPGAASGPGRPRPRTGTAPVRRPRACRAAWRSRPPGPSRRAAERARAARSRSSGIRMSPWMPVTAWKMPRSGVAAVALALGGGAGLGGHLEAQQVPAAQRGGELGGRAGLALPGELGAPGAGRGGLPDPVEVDAHAEHPATAHSTCGHSARGAECTYRTPRVVTGTSGRAGQSCGRHGRRWQAATLMARLPCGGARSVTYRRSPVPPKRSAIHSAGTLLCGRARRSTCGVGRIRRELPRVVIGRDVCSEDARGTPADAEDGAGTPRAVRRAASTAAVLGRGRL